METVQRQHLSEDEYFETERHGDVKHEYVNGQLIAMAGASYRHNVIAGNIVRELGVRLGTR